MACATCVNECCVRPCVEQLECAMDCCGCCHIPVLLAPNVSLKAGTILGQRTSDLRFDAFDPLAVDGRQIPRGLLMYHAVTNDQGAVIDRYFGHLGLGLECGPLYTNMYVCGIFRIQELIGDVASAVASNWLRLLDGNVGGSGLVRL